MSGSAHPIDKLVLYYQGCADELELKAKNVGLFQNNPDAGGKREDILANFLDRHLPARCRVNVGGYIFDSFGSESKQIDIFVANDLSLQFIGNRDNRFEKHFNCIEGCYAVISVKTLLNQAQLYDAMDNLLSVPKLDQMNTLLQLQDSHLYIEEIPQRIIFAYDGIKSDTLKEHLNNYAFEHGIEAKYLPHMIIVNKKYHFSKVGPWGYKEGKQPRQEWGVIQTWEGTPHTGGISLMHMLTRIQKYSTICSQLIINYDRYYVQMKIREETMQKEKTN
jgi:hypothetical protein